MARSWIGIPPFKLQSPRCAAATTFETHAMSNHWKIGKDCTSRYQHTVCKLWPFSEANPPPEAFVEIAVCQCQQTPDAQLAPVMSMIGGYTSPGT